MNFNSPSHIDKTLLFRIYASLVVIFFIILLLRFYYLQIRGHSRFEEISTSNFEKTVPLIPPRGDIYDRNGRLLVTEKPAFSLYAIPAEFDQETLYRLQKILYLDSAKTWKKIGKWKHYKPVKIYRQLPDSSFTFLMENYLDFKGIEVRVEPRRRYLGEANMSHLLGTLGEVTEKDMQSKNNKNNDNKKSKNKKNIEEGDIVGKKGIEKYYDNELRGEKGYKFINVDAYGREIHHSGEDKTVAPKPGYDLYLTIDVELQRYGEEMFWDKRGAMVVIDVTNGEIISLVSFPTYDLNLFTGPIKQSIWTTLISDSTNPLYDRPIQSTYPPGSTFKIVSAIAALHENVVSPNWTINCPGYYRLGRRTIRCWKSDGHGEVKLKDAIQNSCNVYFYQLGLKIGLETWSKYSSLFHFGEKTEIDIYGEKAGLVPTFEWYNKKYGKNGWSKGHLANLAIGQGELLVSPLQMAKFAMIVANKGVFYKPHIRKYFQENESDQIINFSNEKFEIKGVDENTYNFVRNAMRDVVTDGTARVLNIPQIEVAGKTGTAQNPHGDDHAWFVGFAPVDKPKLAFAVIVENGGHGSSAAAPIIRNYLLKYLRKYPLKQK